MNATSEQQRPVMFNFLRERVGEQLERKVAKRVHLFIPGSPLTQHRPKPSSINGKARMRTHEQTLANRDSVVNAWRNSVKDWTPWEGPVILEVITAFLTPKDCWSGRYCGKKPDVDNALKLIGDALNQIAWHDDAKIVRAVSEKLYDVDPGTHIRITFLPEVTKPRNGIEKISETEWAVWVDNRAAGTLVKVKSNKYEVRSSHRPACGFVRTLKQGEEMLREAVLP